MKGMLATPTVALSLSCAMFFCAEVEFPIRPEKVTISLLTEADEDSKTWEINEEVRVGAAVQHPQFIDSAYIAFGDGTDSLFHFGTESVSYDTVWISHRYDKAGSKEIELRAWIETLGEKGPVTEQIEVICLPAGFAASLIPSDSMAANAPFSLAVSCTGSVPLAYQWHELDSGALGEENAATLRFASLEKRHAGAYLCVVTNPCGSDTSDTVAIPASLFVPPDTVGPAVTLISPSPDSVLREESTLVALEVTDSSGVDSVTINGVRPERNGSLYESSVVFPDTGEMEIAVVAWDSSERGNRSDTSFTLVYRPADADTVPPEISLISPAEDAVVHTAEVLVRVTATDSSGIDSVTINGAKATYTDGHYERGVTCGDSGTVTLTVTAWDASEQANSSTAEFSFICRPPDHDTTGPVIELVSPSDGDHVLQPTVAVKLRVTDGSGVDSVVVGGIIATQDSGYYHARITLQNTGETEITATAWDASVDRNTNSLTFTLIYDPTASDREAPGISCVTHEDSQTVAGDTVNVIFEVTDAGGIAEVFINGNQVEGSNSRYEGKVALDEGPNTITCRATDASANANADTLTLTLVYDPTVSDTDAPGISCVSHEDGETVAEDTVTVVFEATDAGGMAAVAINGVDVDGSRGIYEREMALDEGPNTITCRATDASANANADTLTLTLVYDPTASDTDAPGISCVSHEDGETVAEDTITVVFEVSDAGGIAGVFINGNEVQGSNERYEGNVALEEGPNTITCGATDASVNANADTLTLALVYDPTADDDTPPGITLLQPQAGDVVSDDSVTVRVTATDENGIAGVTVAGRDADKVNDDTTWQCGVKLSDPPGKKVIRIIAEDGSSNANSDTLELEIEYDPTAADATPPTISLASPTAVPDSIVEVKVNAWDANGISSVTIDGIPAGCSGDTCSAEVTLQELGNNRIEVTATDNSSNGNTAIDTFEVTYDPTAEDTDPPSITLEAPAQPVTQLPVTVTVTVSDPSGVAEVLIDNQPGSKSGTSYSRDLDVGVGSHDIEVYARDESYHANDTTRTFTVTYDPPPPAVDVTIPSSTITTSSMTVSWSQSTVEDFGLFEVVFGTSEASLDHKVTYTSSDAASHTFTGLNDDTPYFARVIVYDENGSSTPGLTVDAKTALLSPPGITLTSPADDETEVAAAAGFSFRVSVGIGTRLTPTVYISEDASMGSIVRQISLSPLDVVSDPTAFDCSLSSGRRLEHGRRYYWNVGCNVSDGTNAKSDTSATSSFYTINQPPQWTAPTFSSTNYRNETISISLDDKASLGVSGSGHSLEFALLYPSGGSATIADNALVWKRPLDMAGDTSVAVRVTDTWSHGRMSDTATFTIGEQAKPAGTEGMRFIPAAGSSFEMGSDNGETNEQPVHTVTFTYDFWMDTTEVTQQEYLATMNIVFDGLFSKEWDYHGDGPTYPAWEISWYEVALFCNGLSKQYGLDTVYQYDSRTVSGGSLELTGLVIDYSKNGYRLPTEAEWEYACRGGSATEYYWGDNPDPKYANGDQDMGGWPEDGYTHLAPVAQFLPNSHGLYDMSGNVREWCNDRYGDYASTAQTDPTGPATGDSRVVRGGGAEQNPVSQLRSASRVNLPPSDAYYPFGFRVVRPVR